MGTLEIVREIYPYYMSSGQNTHKWPYTSYAICLKEQLFS